MSEIPMGYAAIKDLAKVRRCTIPELLGMSRTNDPFFFGSPAHQRDAEWFAEWWHRLGFAGRSGVHLRAIHYRLVSQDPPPVLPDGTSYLNTLECWSYLTTASKAARYLRLVDVEAFEDHRNPDPMIHARRLVEASRELVAEPWREWDLPEVRAGFGSFYLPLPTFSATGYEYDAARQPYHLEVWVEKSTMNSVLLPICWRHNVNLVTSVGFQSVSSAVDLLRRVESHGKPARILFISDFDPAGSFMPDAVARQLEYWRERLSIDVDIKLQPLALTREQVVHYALPGIPIKESDRRKASFERRNGMEATELDALEALRPGELERLVVDAIFPYQDLALPDRWQESAKAAESVAHAAASWVVADVQSECRAIQSGVRAVLDGYHERITHLNADLQRDLEPFKPRLEVVRHAIQSAMEQVPEAFPLPEPPISDLLIQDDEDWLFDSSRDYLDQLKYYKARRADAEEVP